MAELQAPRLTFWGSRGSIPVGGPARVRYGGATACISLTDQGRRIVVDAGSGLREYGKSLTSTEPDQHHTILLSHLHWDHIAGLPFFPPLYQSSAAVEILGPNQPTATLKSVVAGLMAPAVWPLSPLAALTVTPVQAGEFQAGGFAVNACQLAHAGLTLGYRITCPSGPIVSYVTDNELAAMHPALRQALVQLVAGSDVLVHDATWNDALLPERSGWGHSSGSEAVALGLDAGCRTVVLFHHDPDADDAALDRQVESARRQAAEHGGSVVVAAADGMILDL
ncbi:MAG: MBL fold metallo-hydrolase [Gemmatimonadota bacterium]|nr:MBL fold metallo-hydrolase [Gemmatimonadota bacterium]